MKSNKKKKSCRQVPISKAIKNEHKTSKTHPNNIKYQEYPAQKDAEDFLFKTLPVTKETAVEEVEAVSSSNKKYHWLSMNSKNYDNFLKKNSKRLPDNLIKRQST